MARASKRTREIAIRSSLGADRRRLIGQLLPRACCSRWSGAVLGVLLAYVGVKAFNAAIVGHASRRSGSRSPSIPWPCSSRSGATLVAGLLSGLVPALPGLADRRQRGAQGRGPRLLQPAHGHLHAARWSSRRWRSPASPDRRRPDDPERGQDGTIGSEIDTANLFTAASPCSSRLPGGGAARALLRDAAGPPARGPCRGLRAAATTYLPVGGGPGRRAIAVEGRPIPPSEDQPRAHMAWISPGFFDDLRRQGPAGAGLRREGHRRQPAGGDRQPQLRREDLAGGGPDRQAHPVQARCRASHQAEPWRTVDRRRPGPGHGRASTTSDRTGGLLHPARPGQPGVRQPGGQAPGTRTRWRSRTRCASR